MFVNSVWELKNIMLISDRPAAWIQYCIVHRCMLKVLGRYLKSSALFRGREGQPQAGRELFVNSAWLGVILID